MIFKKIVLVLALAGLLNAADFDMKLQEYGEFTRYIGFTTDSKIDIEGERRNNWVGLYKKGTSNDWGNVIQWSWVRNLEDLWLGHGNFGQEVKSIKVLFPLKTDLQPDKYELRFFKNNSYTVYRTLSIPYYAHGNFKFNPWYDAEKMVVSPVIASYAPGLRVYLFKDHQDSYKREDALMHESYGEPEELDMLNIYMKDYPTGDYVLKLFYGFSPNAQDSWSFHHTNDAVENKDVFNDGITIHSLNALKLPSLKKTPSNESRKDWIAVFPMGASHVLKNLVAWSYIPADQAVNGITLKLYDANLAKNGSYQLVYMKNNSYTVFGDVSSLTIDLQGGEQASIQASTSMEHQGLMLKTTASTSGSLKDWVGIYKKGDSDSWNNVRAWAWRSKAVLDGINIDKLPAGEYELRLFYRNSFKLEAKDAFSIVK